MIEIVLLRNMPPESTSLIVAVPSGSGWSRIFEVCEADYAWPAEDLVEIATVVDPGRIPAGKRPMLRELHQIERVVVEQRLRREHYFRQLRGQ